MLLFSIFAKKNIRYFKYLNLILTIQLQTLNPKSVRKRKNTIFDIVVNSIKVKRGSDGDN